MALMMQRTAVRPIAGQSRARCVVVKADAASARQWIDNWRNKQAAQSNRPSWFPGSKFPAHLDGTLVGDHGFDPLGLGKDPAKLKWYQQAELQNGRWAMLGVVGILVPELLSKAGGLAGPAGKVAWYDVGNYTYWAPVTTLEAISFFLFFFAESRRLMDMANPGSQDQAPFFGNKVTGAGLGYPGFDPLGYMKGNAAQQAEWKLKEIKNGRLAMLAFAGFLAQHITTGTTPLNNLAAHLADPYATTVLSNEHARLL